MKKQNSVSPIKVKLQFSGHETFPLRQLWLRKAYDAVSDHAAGAPKTLFAEDSSIAKFGVGKNMVSSIRFWASACNVIEEDAQSGTYVATETGHLLFHPTKGVDRYSENPATPWLIHWTLSSTPESTTTWHYVFNHVVQQSFDRDGVVSSLSALASERGQKVSLSTLKRDVDCCIRSYSPHSNGDSPEEVSEPVLGELGLLHETSRGTLEFRRGPKRSLPDGVFAYALLDYWERLEHAGSVMAFDRVAHDYGAPGRVFKLDENSVADRLTALEQISGGLIQWTEQAGIRQVTRTGAALNDISAVKLRLLKAVYKQKMEAQT